MLKRRKVLRKRRKERKYMGKKRCALAGMFLLWALVLPGLTGCGGEEESEGITNLRISKDGAVTSSIVEDFGKSFYTLDTLQAMVNEEINTHNAEHPNTVSLQGMELSEDTGGVLVTLQYASCADYEDFNGVELFYGTPAEAEAAGYDLNMLDGSFSDAEGSEVKLGREEILAIKNAKILVVRQSAQVSRISLPAKVLYVNGGSITGGRTVELPGPEETGDIEWQGGLTYVITK